MTLGLAVAVFVLTWAATALILDSRIRRRRRPDLAERLRPDQPTVAAEAEAWLRHRS